MSPPRDPGAPKRNMSAYLLYQNAMRDTFRAQNPGMTFGQLAKYTSAMYAEMPPQEKEAWNARAEADKARYLHELSSYIPPPGYDAKGDAIATNATHKPRRGPGASNRDPNAPKRNMSAYLLYQNCMREQFKSQNPGMTFGQLAKYTSHMYKSLSPQERARWEAHAAQDKARYEAEIATYVPPPGYDSQGNMIEDRRSRSKLTKKNKDPNRPKRARGSFVFFTFDMRPKVAKEFPGIKFVEMGNVLGERWRALTPDEKAKYEDMATQDKYRFNKEMEEYTAKKIAEGGGLQSSVPPGPAAQPYMPMAPPVGGYIEHPPAAMAPSSHPSQLPEHPQPPQSQPQPQPQPEQQQHQQQQQQQQQQQHQQQHAPQYDQYGQVHHQQLYDPNIHGHPGYDPNGHGDPYAQAPYPQGYEHHQYHYA